MVHMVIAISWLFFPPFPGVKNILGQEPLLGKGRLLIDSLSPQFLGPNGDPNFALYLANTTIGVHLNSTCEAADEDPDGHLPFEFTLFRHGIQKDECHSLQNGTSQALRIWNADLIDGAARRMRCSAWKEEECIGEEYALDVFADNFECREPVKKVEEGNAATYQSFKCEQYDENIK